jgi:hypothetical protein
MDGVLCWISPRDIDAGADWNSAITEAISASQVMVLIWSSNSNASQDVTLEVKHGFRQGIPVIPFRIEDVPPPKSLEYYLTFVQWLDAFTPPLEKHLQQLSEHVRAVLQGTAGADTKEGGVSLSAAGPPPIQPAQKKGRKVRLGWLLPLIIFTVALLTLIPLAIGWWREQAGMERQPSATPTPADDTYEYPVANGYWIYKGWDNEKVLKMTLVERLRLEDAVREFIKNDKRMKVAPKGPGDTQDLRAAQWHVLHTYAEIPPQPGAPAVGPSQDSKLTCSSCHKSVAPDVDRDTPRTTCAKCH